METCQVNCNIQLIIHSQTSAVQVRRFRTSSHSSVYCEILQWFECTILDAKINALLWVLKDSEVNFGTTAQLLTFMLMHQIFLTPYDDTSICIIDRLSTWPLTPVLNSFLMNVIRLFVKDTPLYNGIKYIWNINWLFICRAYCKFNHFSY